MPHSQRLAASVAVLVCIAARCGAERAAAEGRPYGRTQPPRRVVVFIIDRISLSELMQQDYMPRLTRDILPHAAIGLMNGGIVGRPSEKDIWTTLGAGCPAGDSRAVPGLLGDTLGKAGFKRLMVRPFPGAVPGADAIVGTGKDVQEIPMWLVCDMLGCTIPDERGLQVAPAPNDPTYLRTFDTIISEELGGPLSQTLAILISPSAPSNGSLKNASLCPFIMFGRGINPGLLTSASTRRLGVVAAVDLAPTVLDWFGIKTPRQMTGHPIRILPHADPLHFALRLERRTAQTYAQRFPLVAFYAWFQAAAFAFAAVVLLRKSAPRLRRLALAGVLICMSLPLGFLLSGLLQSPSAWHSVVTAIAAAALLSLAALRLGMPRGLAFAAAAVAAVPACDLATGARLMQSSVLGSDPVIGARFYGLGNEHMAIMLGAAALAMGFGRQCAPERRRAWIPVLPLWLALVLIIGAPQIGVDFGGALTAAAMLPLVVWPQRGRIRLWHLAAGAAAIVIAAALVVGLDLLRRPEAQSHIGQAARLVGAHGPTAAWPLLAGRLGTSLRLFLFTPWNGLGFIICLSAVAAIAAAPAGARALREQYPFAWSGLAAAALGAVAATLFNDSGVVAGGAMMTYVLAGLLALLLMRGQGNAGG